jgi:hypothetical protein
VKRTIVALFMALALTGCGDAVAGPPCVKSHMEMRQTVEYTPECALGIDGRYDCGKFKMKYVTRPVTVCDKYGPMPAKEVESN